VVLALVGGTLGLLGSRLIVSWFRNWLVTTTLSISGGLGGVFLNVAVDWRVAVYAALLSLLIGLAIGIWPALRAARSDANLVLREGGTSTPGSAAWGRRNLLLRMQVAGSLVLLTAAGMLLGGSRASRRIDPGFDADHVLLVVLDDGTPLTSRAAQREEIARRLAALPAVRAVAWTRRVPFAGTYLRTGQYAGARLTASVDEVNGDYFAALGIGVERGRTFTREEVARGAPVMIVSESMARLRWPGGIAIGRSVSPHELFAGPDTTRAYTVVGVVRDVRSQFLSRPNGPSIYFPYRFDVPYGAFLLRTRGTPASAATDVRVAIGGVSPLLIGHTHVITLQSGPMALQRLMAAAPASVALVLALAGLLLASIGMYGVIAQIVSRRAREIGVHMAMGARPLQVIRLVAVKTLGPVAWGAVVGSGGAVALSLFLHSLISVPDMPDLTFGAGAFNPIIFLAVLGIFAFVVTAACFVPAHRAATIDPTIALRLE
jgi:putative ABC transport system permease protein